jgi:hypothetical protein
MKAAVYDQEHRVHTEWQLPLHGGKISPVCCRGVHAHPPFTLPSRTKLWCTLHAAERADTLPLFLLHPYMYSVIKTTTTKNCRCNV